MNNTVSGPPARVCARPGVVCVKTRCKLAHRASILQPQEQIAAIGRSPDEPAGTRGSHCVLELDPHAWRLTPQPKGCAFGSLQHMWYVIASKRDKWTELDNEGTSGLEDESVVIEHASAAGVEHKLGHSRTLQWQVRAVADKEAATKVCGTLVGFALCMLGGNLVLDNWHTHPLVSKTAFPPSAASLLDDHLAASISSSYPPSPALPPVPLPSLLPRWPGLSAMASASLPSPAHRSPPSPLPLSPSSSTPPSPPPLSPLPSLPPPSSPLPSTPPSPPPPPPPPSPPSLLPSLPPSQTPPSPPPSPPPPWPPPVSPVLSPETPASWRASCQDWCNQWTCGASDCCDCGPSNGCPTGNACHPDATPPSPTPPWSQPASPSPPSSPHPPPYPPPPPLHEGIETINNRFVHGHPSNDLALAGVLVHQVPCHHSIPCHYHAILSEPTLNPLAV